MYNLALWSPHHITEIFLTALLCLNVSIMTLNCTVLIFTALCQDGNVRLANGPTSYSGRVEICFSETWGTVCNNMWGASDASVVCRQLGFSRHSTFISLFQLTGTYTQSYGIEISLLADATTQSGAAFGQGSGPISLTNVGCTGNEARLADCLSSNNTVGCTHSRDASATCVQDCKFHN